jgi:hypothetical protein
MSSILKAAAACFALVFGAGFALGAARVLWIAPRIGARSAELLEMPVMLVVVVAAARWLVRRFPRIHGRAGWYGAGGLAAGLILTADFGVAVYMRGLPLDRYLSELDPVTAVPYYAILALCAVTPALLFKKEQK